MYSGGVYFTLVFFYTGYSLLSVNYCSAREIGNNSLMRGRSVGGLLWLNDNLNNCAICSEAFHLNDTPNDGKLKERFLVV